MTNDKPAHPKPLTTTGQTADHNATLQIPKSAVTPNPGPHNPDAHGPEHGTTQDTAAQKLENEAATGEENRY